MKRLILLVPFLFILGACNNLERIMNGAESRPPAPVPAQIVVEGQTTSNYQTLGGIPHDGRKVTAFVKRDGEADFRQLNQYEFKLIPGSDSVQLWREIIVYSEHMIVITGKPAAPIGSYYRIISEKAS